MLRRVLPFADEAFVRFRHGRVQIGLGAEAENDGVARLDISAVPMLARADLSDRVFRGAEQADDLSFGELRELAQKKGDGVWAIVSLCDRRVTRPFGASRDRIRRRDKLEARVGIRFAARNFRLCDLIVLDGIVAVDSGRHFSVSDRLNLQRVHTAKFGDLRKSQAGFFDQPHGGGFWHQRESHVSKVFRNSQ